MLLGRTLLAYTSHVLVVIVSGVQHVGKKLLLTPVMPADVLILVNKTRVVFVKSCTDFLILSRL
jgi:hypothetical protein